jgi:hypothetical protein
MLGIRLGGPVPLYGGQGSKFGKVYIHLWTLVLALLAEILANFVGYQFNLRAFIVLPFVFLAFFGIFRIFIGIFLSAFIGSIYSRALGFSFSIPGYLVLLVAYLMFLM